MLLQTMKASHITHDRAPIELLGDELNYVVSHLDTKSANNLAAVNRAMRRKAPRFPESCMDAKTRLVRQEMRLDPNFRCVRSAMYNPETLQRILLCNMSPSREHAEPLRLYVTTQQVDALLLESTLICFAKAGFPIELVLLYPRVEPEEDDTPDMIREKDNKIKAKYDKCDDILRRKSLPPRCRFSENISGMIFLTIE